MAGHEFEVEKVHGLGVGPKLFQHKTEGRKKVEELSGSPTVPVLVTRLRRGDLGLQGHHRLGRGEPGHLGTASGRSPLLAVACKRLTRIASYPASP